jgi:hypothetical protein
MRSPLCAGNRRLRILLMAIGLQVMLRPAVAPSTTTSSGFTIAFRQAERAALSARIGDARRGAHGPTVLQAECRLAGGDGVVGHEYLVGVVMR